MLLIYNKNPKMIAAKVGELPMKRIAYFTTYFPRYDESAVYREFLQLAQLNIPVVPFARRWTPPGPIPNEAMSLLEHTQIISEKSIFHKLGAHFSRLVNSPFRYLKAFFLQLSDASLWPGDILRAFGYFYHGVILSRMLEREKIEHLHVHFIGAPASIALTVHRLIGIPFSIAVYSKDILRPPPDLLVKIKKASRIIANTDHVLEFVRGIDDTVAAKKFKLVRASVDTSVFSPRPEKDVRHPLEKPRIITITKLTRSRRVDTILQACKILNVREVDFEIIIVGDGPGKHALQQMTNDLRLNHRVRFTGARRMEEIIDLLKNADLFVLPSSEGDEAKKEGIPTALLEAMACGIPVVAGESAGITEVLDATNGRLLTSDNPGVLAATIEELLAHSLIRTRLGEAARQTILAEYDLKKNARKLIEQLLSD